MVAEEGHLTRSAERLHTSQPAVSAHIKALEEELGVALFKRTPKGMLLTHEGEILRQQALRALSTIDEIGSSYRSQVSSNRYVPVLHAEKISKSRFSSAPAVVVGTTDEFKTRKT